jgi:hypothetical protein
MNTHIKTRRRNVRLSGAGGPGRQLGTLKNKRTQLKYQQFQAKRKQNWEKKGYGALTYKRTLELQKKGYKFPSSEEDNKKLLKMVFPELVKAGVKLPSLKEIKELMKIHQKIIFIVTTILTIATTTTTRTATVRNITFTERLLAS